MKMTKRLLSFLLTGTMLMGILQPMVVSAGKTAYFKYNGDEDLDVIVTEKNELSEEMASIYFNDVYLTKGDTH